MKTSDLARSLEMIEEAIHWSLEAHEKESERNAALHMQTKVMYSPICTSLQEARTKIEALRLNLIPEEGRTVTIEP